MAFSRERTDGGSYTHTGVLTRRKGGTKAKPLREICNGERTKTGTSELCPSLASKTSNRASRSFSRHTQQAAFPQAVEMEIFVLP